MSQIRHQPVAPTHAETKAAGDLIDRHRHDDHQLIYVSAGVAAVSTELGQWVATPERAVWIPAGLWHEHRFHGRSLFHSLGFPLADAVLGTTSPTVVAVQPLVRELVVACTEPGIGAAEERRLRDVLRDRLRRTDERPLSVPVARDPRLADACRLCLDDLSTPRSTGWLAKQVGISERTLARLFRTELKTTYPQWRTQARVVHALVLLAEGESVSVTGRRCGWATTSAFVDTFARTMGATPGAYRQTG